jgi:hypothetical protein
MEVRVIGESERITLLDLAWRIGTGKIDIHSNDWGQSDAEQRRKIAESLTNDTILASLLEMASQGKIKPLSLVNGQLVDALLDATSWISNEDIDIAIQCFRVAINRRAIRLGQEDEKRAADRYTIEEAAKELAAHTGLDVKRWRQTLLSEVKQGKLPLKNPRDFGDWLPYEESDSQRRVKPAARDFLLMCEQVAGCDLNSCLESHPEWKIAYRFGTASIDAQPALETRLPVSVQQEIAVINKIRELGINPEAFPINAPGKRGRKADVCAAILQSPSHLFPSQTVFKLTWERLRAARRIVDAPAAPGSP